MRGCLLRRAAVVILAVAAAFSGLRRAVAEEPETTSLPETVVIGERITTADPVIARWDREAIAAFGPRVIDELLATEPSFSLYRRQSSLFGNPTSAGVSLRRTGATAAARTLVLRDGIPQNDPFGGWVSWARYRPELIASARIVPAAQSAVWGNLSPAGVVQLTTREPVANGLELEATGGSDETRGLSAAGSAVSRDAGFAVQAAGFVFQSDGFFGLDPAQRGPIDRRLDLDVRGGEARFVWRPADGVTLEPAVALFREERGNGTPLARNATDAIDASLRATGEGDRHSWQALAYYQRRDFEAVFSSVDDARRTEAPALEQFDVPGEGIGGGVTLTRHAGERLDLMAGADVRHLRGETNEDAGFVDGSFLRRRRAAGTQMLAGIFARSSLRFGEGGDSAIDASVRLDHWRLGEGERVERRPSTGALLRRDSFDDRDGWEPSLSVAVRHEATETVALRASAGTAFRIPTINELHRPFRVRDDITEANAALDPERFLSLEGGATWRPGADGLELALDGFFHHIDDAIANVPISDPVEAAALAGFVPPGGSVAQRRNVEAARVWGLETRARWEPAPIFSATLAYLFTRTEFVDSPDQPALEGKAFPQSPEHRVVAGVEGRPLERLRLFAQVDAGGEQFDDALERRALDPWWTVRLGAGLEVTDNVSLHARVENLFDEPVETGLSSSGLRSIGVPRSFWCTVRVRW